MVFNNGLIIQCEFVSAYTSAGSTASGTHNFPIAFKNKYTISVALRRDTDWGYTAVYGGAVGSYTSTSFYFRFTAVNNSQFITGFDYIAIGT